jgi:hypothetical protein
MPAQQRNLRKNYIGIVSERLEEQCAVESAIKAGHPVRDYFLALLAAVLKRRRQTRS